MKETTLIPVMMLGFTCIVILALYLERMVDKKKKQHFLRKRMGLQRPFYYQDRIRFVHEEDESPKENKMNEDYPDQLIEGKEGVSHKLKALEQIDV